MGLNTRVKEDGARDGDPRRLLDAPPTRREWFGELGRP